MTNATDSSGQEQLFAVKLLARNYIVPWPSPIWWVFKKKVPRRMGFRVTIELRAPSATAAREQAEARIRKEMTEKATNDGSDPFRLDIEGVALADDPTPDAGVKRWFHEEE